MVVKVINSEMYTKLPRFVAFPDPEVYLKSDNYITLDFETTSLEKGDAGIDANRLVLAVWLDVNPTQPGRNKITVCRAGEFGQNELRTRCESADFVVCHNTKFELKWLHRMGVDLRGILPYCTQIGEYVISGNRKRPLGLDAVAHRYGVGGKGHLVGRLIKLGYPVEDIPEKLLEEYCTNDVKITHSLFLAQRRALADTGLLRVAYARNLVTPVLADIEYKGTRLDDGRVRIQHLHVLEKHTSTSKRFEEITGGVNFRSSKQVRAYVYDKLHFEELQDYRGNPVRTKAGKPSTGKDVIAKLEAKTPEQKEFKEALLAVLPLKRKMQILEQMVKCVKEDEGKIYASFNQTVSGTHRLTSTGGKWGFQFHNFPREFKPLFRARRDGWVVVEADAPQLEFRAAVDLGNDEVGRKDIRDGVDIHGFSASEIGVDRQAAKAFTFRPLYGGNSGTPRQRAYFKAFRERYAAIYETQRGWTYEVLANKRLRTPTGLIFYWPDTEMQRSGYITNTTNIFNYPIQMFATADIIPLTLVLVWHYVKQVDVKIVNTVHDSIIADVLPEQVERYKEVLKQAFTVDIYKMLKVLYNYDFKTPLGVNIKVAEHWGDEDAEETKYEAEV